MIKNLIKIQYQKYILLIESMLKNITNPRINFNHLMTRVIAQSHIDIHDRKPHINEHLHSLIKFQKNTPSLQINHMSDSETVEHAKNYMQKGNQALFEYRRALHIILWWFNECRYTYVNVYVFTCMKLFRSYR